MRHEAEGEALNPETTRAFLRVHAEREARAQAPPPDAPTVADLAESLGMPLEEAQSILREARARVAGESVVDEQAYEAGGSMVRRSRTIALTFVGLGVLILGTLLLRPRTVPAPSWASETIPLVTPAQMATPDPFMTPYAPGAAVTNVDRLANGFEISVAGGNMETTEPGTTPPFGTSYRALSPETAQMVREEVAERVVKLVGDPETVGHLQNAGSLKVVLKVAGGKPTTLRVPIPAYSLPFEGNPGAREALKASLVRTMEAGWPAIVDATPQ